jgi:hypothetical protein
MSWNQNAWANVLRYEKLDCEQHLFLFQLLRSSMRPILAELTTEQSERAGVYAEAGRFTFMQLLEYRVQHIRDHLAQIARVREAFRQSRV